jgi:Domain of unknown function (DUF4129)
MISGLVNFLVMLFYQGNFPARVTWTLFFYTMGAVAIARIAIEQTRAYAHGYAFILGIAGFFVMSGYLGSVVFTALILFIISFLADRIVHDCTLIDETADASGQGLVDFGKDLVHAHLNKPESEPVATASGESSSTNSDSPATKKAKFRSTHQPGRTVMWLALAALPLFGLGQFMLRDDPATWERAKFLLAIYLFASLSLLVTTSFLGLRRYLRQRGADMPGNVSVGWIAGGLLSILMILFVAYLAPVPGQLLASVKIPDFLDSPDDQQASRYGWGDEGAQRQSEDDATVNQPTGEEDTPPSGEFQQGAKPGEADHGNAKDAPAGTDPGGKKQGGSKSSETESSKSEASEPQSKQSQSSQPKSDMGQEQSGSKQEPNASGKKNEQSQDSSQPKPENQANEENTKKNSDNKQPQESKQQDDSKSGDDAKDSPKQEQSDEPRDDDQTRKSDDESKDSDENKQEPKTSNQPSGKNAAQRSMEAISSSLPAISGLLRWLIMLGLMTIIAFYVWKNYEALLEWWRSLFGLPPSTAVHGNEDVIDSMKEPPPRSFSSFENPVGRENDPRRAVVITFQAFEAWSREQGWRRIKDETPSEFLKRISVAIPQAAEPAGQIVDAYNRIVYGRGNASSADIRAVNLIWSLMTKSLASTG